jgi:hypothetical protein
VTDLYRFLEETRGRFEGDPELESLCNMIHHALSPIETAVGQQQVEEE